MKSTALEEALRETDKLRSRYPRRERNFETQKQKEDETETQSWREKAYRTDAGRGSGWCTARGEEGRDAERTLRVEEGTMVGGQAYRPSQPALQT